MENKGVQGWGLVCAGRKCCTVKKNISCIFPCTGGVRENSNVILNTMIVFCVYYRMTKRELHKRLIYECRCNERLKEKDERSTCLVYTGLSEGLEHLNEYESL
jgi:hypothetical protein